MIFFIHYFLHFVFPGVVAFVLFRRNWRKAFIVMLLTMLVDLDHLLATPIFDINRCSVGFHPLHSHYMIVVYIIMLLFRKTRIVGLGLCLHMVTDLLDCYLRNNT